MMPYMQNAKLGFIIRSIVILGSEMALFALPNTILSWILRIIFTIVVLWSYAVLYHRTSFTQVNFFPTMLFINGAFAINMLNIRYGFLPRFVDYVLGFIIVSSYFTLFRGINKYNQLIEKGYHPEFDREEFAKKMDE